MGITAVAAITGANDSSAGSTYALGTFSGTAGEFIVLILATDNLTTTDGNTNDHTSITTSTGETWTKVYEFTNGNAAAAAGACISVWRTTVPSGGNMTPTANFSSSITKKAFVAYRYTVAAGSAPAKNAATPSTLANDAADPGSMTLGSLANIEHLWVRAISSETNSVTALTVTSSWTTMGAQTTTGGTSATNIAVRGEFLITKATTATSDPTFTSADTASILVAFDENQVARPPQQGFVNHQNPGVF